MDTRRIRTRLERIERLAGIEPGPELVVVIRGWWHGRGDTVPNVIDRPLEEWEVYKQAPVQRWIGCTGRVVTLDPRKEYRLRTGRDEAPLEDRIPSEVFEKWMDSGTRERLESVKKTVDTPDQNPLKEY